MTPETLARSLLDALETGDFAPWAARMAPGFSYSYPGLRGAHGQAQALAFNQTFPRAFPDLKFTVTGSARSGNRVYLSWTATATHSGPLEGPGGTLPATFRRGTLTGVLVAEIDGERIAREETYWNLPDLIEQLIPQQSAA